MKNVGDPLGFFRRARFSTGEIARVRQLVRPSSGRSLILPYDQFIEHDCRHLDSASDAGNPQYICSLAHDGGYNAVVLHYGLAKRYWSFTEGAVPLIVKVNGKTSIPSDDHPLSVYTGRVEDAVRLGAIAIGYTMYYGSSRQDEDLPQLTAVRRECERYGLPLIVWAYPRGAHVDRKGGRSSSYIIESATRMAAEMGATIIKSNIPKPMISSLASNAWGNTVINNFDRIPSYYQELEKALWEEAQKAGNWSAVEEKRAAGVVTSAQGIPVLFSGGDHMEEDELLKSAKACIKGGCFGFIFGRNMWKRPYNEAHSLSTKLHTLLDS